MLVSVHHMQLLLGTEKKEWEKLKLFKLKITFVQLIY